MPMNACDRTWARSAYLHNFGSQSEASLRSLIKMPTTSAGPEPVVTDKYAFLLAIHGLEITPGARLVLVLRL